jgi:rfaE bifunctional protein nucleotidyltransferase chain/domain
MGTVTNLSTLQAIRAQARAVGQTVVFTNGAFDLLHVGHVRYLQAARALGDMLIVGLNSDSSVRAYKGPARPLIAQDERAELLAALGCVDYVVIFDEPTAEAVVGALQPDIYVKGGDYRPDTSGAPPLPREAGSDPADKPLPEAPIVRAYGGRVVIVPYVPGKSTTNLIERIKDSTM